MSSDVDISGARRPLHLTLRLSKYRRSASARLGTLFAARSNSGSRVNNSYILQIRCARGHEFEVSSRDLLRGCWCQECSAIEKAAVRDAALARLKQYAEDRGGECVASAYISAKAPLLWRCFKKGHDDWMASADNVMNHKSWCPACAREEKRSR